MYKKIILVLIVAISLCSCKNQSNNLEVHSIDVGQGDSSLIISPSGQTMLVDAGEEEYSRNVIRHLKRSHIRHLDYIICTHFDSDHIGGVDKVIEEFDVSRVCLPPDRGKQKDLIEVINICKRKNIRVSPLKSRDRVKLGDDTKITILSPSSKKDDTNENSIVFLMQYKNQYMMFTGDASSNIEGEILASYRLPHICLLKLGHHGSKTSTSEELLNATKPNIGLVSCGYKNHYGHPHPDTLDRLHKYRTRVYRTDTNGDMVFMFDGSKIYTRKRYKWE